MNKAALREGGKMRMRNELRKIQNTKLCSFGDGRGMRTYDKRESLFSMAFQTSFISQLSTTTHRDENQRLTVFVEEGVWGEGV